jgi:arylsulfatase
MQFITDGHLKYIYYPGPGEEQLFDLDADPDEMYNLIDDPEYADAVQRQRDRLISELDGRPERFVRDGVLVPLGGPTRPYLPELERES